MKALTLLTAACLAACSSASTEEETGPLPADAIVVEASATTRGEARIAHWSLEEQGRGSLRGYDEDLHVRVVFHYAQQIRNGHELGVFTLEENDERAHLAFSRDAAGAVTMLESTVDARFARLAELLGNDLRSMKVETSPSLATNAFAVGTTKLSPLDDTNSPPKLVEQECVDLINKCNAAAVKLRAVEAQFTQFCGLDANPNAASAYCEKELKKQAPRFPSPEHCLGWINGSCDEATNQLGPAKREALWCESDPQSEKKAACESKLRISN